MVVINPSNWKNARKYNLQTQGLVKKETIWNEKQNYPDLITNDLIKHFDKYDESYVRDVVLSTLLRRGVNKWFLVRKLLIRLKKHYVDLINEDRKELDSSTLHPSTRAYIKGRMAANTQIRDDLLTLCQAPRWVIWNQKSIGLMDTIGMKPSYKSKFVVLFNKLMNAKFRK